MPADVGLSTYEGQRFCGITEQESLEARRMQLQWRNKRRLKWFVADRIPGVSLEILTASYAAAFGAWQKVCGLVFSQTLVQAEADFLIRTMLRTRSDGSGGVLAEHELPPGNDRPLNGWWDPSERWSFAQVPPANAIDHLAVSTHEIGHGIGLPHEETRTVTALLDPYYNPKIRIPQDWDIQQAQARYGSPVEEPIPPVDPPPGTPVGTFTGMLDLGAVGVYRVIGTAAKISP